MSARSVFLVLLAAATAGCAFTDGRGFSTLEGGELEARLSPRASRQMDDRTVSTDAGYRVTFDRVEVVLGDLELLEAVTSGGSGSAFDPENPPPGYTFCHGGHCHTEDDRLVPYEDIEAELSGGSTSFRQVARLEVTGPFDLLASDRRTLDRVEPSRELPEAHVARIAVHLTRLELEATVTAGPEPGGLGASTARLDVGLDLGLELVSAVDVKIDDDGPEELRLEASILVDGTLLDGIDLAALSENGAITLGDPSSAEAAAVVEALASDTIFAATLE